jgi:hypothetical protein
MHHFYDCVCFKNIKKKTEKVPHSFHAPPFLGESHAYANVIDAWACLQTAQQEICVGSLSLFRAGCKIYIAGAAVGPAMTLGVFSVLNKKKMFSANRLMIVSCFTRSGSARNPNQSMRRTSTLAMRRSDAPTLRLPGPDPFLERHR